MTKTLNQLGEATDLDTPDLLLTRDTSTGDDKRITLNNSRFSRHGLTESVTLSSGVLTIPVGMSTIKLPTSVWDGSSNITISAIAFEDGVQPAVGYEFSVVVPKTTDAGSLTAGALGNEALIQDGASIAVEANNNADLPCYPNAADNPGTDPVQFAAPYYRLDFRVDSYDGSGDPVVSLVRLPDAVFVSNDRGEIIRTPEARQSCSTRTIIDRLLGDGAGGGSDGSALDVNYPADFSALSSASLSFAETTSAQGRVADASNTMVGARSDRWRVAAEPDWTNSDIEMALSAEGEWY